MTPPEPGENSTTSGVTSPSQSPAGEAPAPTARGLLHIRRSLKLDKTLCRVWLGHQRRGSDDFHASR